MKKMKKKISKQNGTTIYPTMSENKWKKKIQSAFTPNKQEQEHLNTNQRTPTLSKNNTTKSPLLEIPKESKVRSGFKYVPREHVGLDGVESSVCSSKVWKQVEEEE